jgi:hypothetical protein
MAEVPLHEYYIIKITFCNSLHLVNRIFDKQQYLRAAPAPPPTRKISEGQPLHPRNTQHPTSHSGLEPSQQAAPFLVQNPVLGVGGVLRFFALANRNCLGQPVSNRNA